VILDGVSLLCDGSHVVKAARNRVTALNTSSTLLSYCRQKNIHLESSFTWVREPGCLQSLNLTNAAALLVGVGDGCGVLHQAGIGGLGSRQPPYDYWLCFCVTWPGNSQVERGSAPELFTFSPTRSRTDSQTELVLKLLHTKRPAPAWMSLA
jgi:hypothetical protein